jgi:hypothetical protein
LTRAFTANIDVTVIRIANKAVSAALQLLVEFIEHEVTQEWRKLHGRVSMDALVLNEPRVAQVATQSLAQMRCLRLRKRAENFICSFGRHCRGIPR